MQTLPLTFGLIRIATEKLELGVRNLVRRWIMTTSTHHTIYRYTYIHTWYINKSNPITGLDRPLGIQEVEAPRFF
jgi:hypothetical protein